MHRAPTHCASLMWMPLMQQPAAATCAHACSPRLSSAQRTMLTVAAPDGSAGATARALWASPPACSTTMAMRRSSPKIRLCFGHHLRQHGCRTTGAVLVAVFLHRPPFCMCGPWGIGEGVSNNDKLLGCGCIVKHAHRCFCSNDMARRSIGLARLSSRINTTANVLSRTRCTAGRRLRGCTRLRGTRGCSRCGAARTRRSS